MPAEWEAQEAVWLSWPHRRATWPGQFQPVPHAYAKFVAAISQFEEVRINAALSLQARAKRLCAAAKADMSQVTFYDHRTDDAWCRDHGPIFVKSDRTGEVAITDWRFNAWGGKYSAFDQDDAIPPLIASELELRRFENGMGLEGGSIDVNGEGLLVTSEQCLLNPNRNPELTRKDIERNLRQYLNVNKVLWVGEGIAGDDTDGHIDDMTRFFKRDGLITCVESDPADINHAPLKENLERLQSYRTPQGRRFTIVELPMPAPVAFQGQRVPASYANFLIVNGAVLVPTFRQKMRDAEACEIIGGCFPDRKIVRVDCYHLIWGLGTLHCLSQQQPASAEPTAGRPALSKR
jgi:agmatine deiminase